jgi:hypothetical protein
MEERRVGSWTELIDALYDGSWDGAHGRFRSPYCFRGLPDWRYHRRTSLCRLGGNFAPLEDDLVRNFRKYAHQSQSPGNSWWNWLALAAHHGLPTRLLDWTFSPFVALHFATEKYDLFHLDGVVWMINFIELRQFLPCALNELLEQDGASVFTAWILDRYARSLDEFDVRAAESGETCVIFFEPPSLDERIVNQSALFSMMSSPVVQLEDWLRQHERENPRLCRKIIIPASLKWEVRDKLDMANVTERVMYPGLDGLSAWLKRYYSPSHQIEVDGELATITKMTDGLLNVEFRDGSSAEVHSTPNGLWLNRQGVRVSITPRPVYISHT